MVPSAVIVVVFVAVFAAVFHEKTRREKTDWTERDSPAVLSAPPRNCFSAFGPHNDSLTCASIPSTDSRVDLECAK